MTLQDLNIIYDWKLPQLWAYILAYEDELDHEDKKDLYEIKYGFDIKIHINYLADNHYKEYPEYEKAIVINKKIPIEELWEEIQKREQGLRKIILAFNEENKVYEPR